MNNIPTDIFNLQTQRLSIAPIQQNDANEIFKLYSSVDLMKYTDNELHTSINDSRQLISRNEDLQENGHGVFCGITQNGTTGVCGTIRLYHFDWKHKFASIGCLLDKKIWNQGLMTEAVNAFCQSAFKHLPLNRIEAQVFKGNAASVRLFKKLNFTFEGELRENFLINGKLENSLLFSILRSDFEI